MMDEAIRKFPEQFRYNPVIENAESFQRHARIVLCGMGGSHLAADILKRWRPHMALTMNRDYGLPEMPLAELEQSLIIASSYSGNTEETLSSFEAAYARKLPLLAISVGGMLIDRAKETGTPYIQMPNTGIQPRVALGLSMRALLKAVGDDALLEETAVLATILQPALYEEAGRALAQKLAGHVPVIYASRRNRAVAYNWKIKFNETGKIPAFYNVMPEMNHNEMTGFDRQGGTAPLSEKFHVLFITDVNDHPRVHKRMQVTKQLYANRGIPVTEIPVEGETEGEGLFRSLLTADWAAYYAAQAYGVEAEEVPMVEEFKKEILE